MSHVRRHTDRAVFFDLDDTLFDHTGTCAAAIGAERERRPFLRTRSLAELTEEYALLLERDQARILSGATTLEEARVERWRTIASRCGTVVSREDAETLSREYRALYQTLRRPVPGAVALLSRLHRRRTIGIVTNNELAEQVEKLAFLGLRPYVDHLVVSEEVGAVKPDRAIFEVALQRANVDPGAATMVGDSWANDVLGARAAGLRPVWFNRFRRPRPDPTEVEELLSFVPLGSAEALLVRS